jgi:hypothetical protein
LLAYLLVCAHVFFHPVVSLAGGLRTTQASSSGSRAHICWCSAPGTLRGQGFFSTFGAAACTLVQSVRGLFVCSCSSEDTFGPFWAFGWSTCGELLPVPVPRVQPADLQQWQSQHPALAWSLLLPLRLCVSLWACFHVLLSTTSHLGSRILPWRLLGPSQVCCLPLCMIV